MSDPVLVRSPRVAARDVGGEMVLLSADDSSMFVLNEVGTAIWKAADGRTTLESIVDAICRDFDVDAATARADLHAFVNALADAGIVRTSAAEDVQP